VTAVKLNIRRSCTVKRTARRSQAEGIFDVAPSATIERCFDVEFTLPAKWSIGVICGPSMAGKTTVARELAKHIDGTFIAARDERGGLVEPFTWPADKCVLDGFPATGADGKPLSIRDITGILSSVGFSSPPDWIKPYWALSNGGQFRVNLARALAESRTGGKPVLFDEYASLVHDTVARIGSAAVAKAVRRYHVKFVAVTWRTDILDWLEPDWVYEPATNRFLLNEEPTGAKGKKKVGGGPAQRLSSKSFEQIERVGSFSSTITI
jgi:hypothetical protein